jgi:DNA-binding MurR/RpiR family transcriptional regulator
VVAEHLNTSESTLERAQHELGIRGWPPARAPVLKDDLRSPCLTRVLTLPDRI